MAPVLVETLNVKIRSVLTICLNPQSLYLPNYKQIFAIIKQQQLGKVCYLYIQHSLNLLLFLGNHNTIINVRDLITISKTVNICFKNI